MDSSKVRSSNCNWREFLQWNKIGVTDTYSTVICNKCVHGGSSGLPLENDDVQ